MTYNHRCPRRWPGWILGFLLGAVLGGLFMNQMAKVQGEMLDASYKALLATTSAASYQQGFLEGTQCVPK